MLLQVSLKIVTGRPTILPFTSFTLKKNSMHYLVHVASAPCQPGQLKELSNQTVSLLIDSAVTGVGANVLSSFTMSV